MRSLRWMGKRILDVFALLLMKSLGGLNQSKQRFGIPPSVNYINDTPYNWLKSLLRIPSNQAWLESKKFNTSIMNGELVPWVTYPTINFLKQIDFREKTVVEFGSGASTLFFAKRCKKIVSYEFDIEYLSVLKKNFNNSNIEFQDLSFVWSLRSAPNLLDPKFRIFLENDLKQNKPSNNFAENTKSETIYLNILDTIATADFVIVDGGPRNFLTAIAASHLKEGALLLIDNSDLEYVQNSFNFLKEAGYFEIPFIGFGPLNPYEYKTSIFLKDLRALECVSRLGD